VLGRATVHVGDDELIRTLIGTAMNFARKRRQKDQFNRPPGVEVVVGRVETGECRGNRIHPMTVLVEHEHVEIRFHFPSDERFVPLERQDVIERRRELLGDAGAAVRVAKCVETRRF
jgi:hypothetical protein